jgi:hypothetical protein
MYAQLSYYYTHRKYKLEYQKKYYKKNKETISRYYKNYYYNKKNNQFMKKKEKPQPLQIRHGYFVVSFK